MTFRAPGLSQINNNNGIMLCVSNEEPSITEAMKCDTIKFLHQHGVSVDQPNDYDAINYNFTRRNSSKV